MTKLPERNVLDGSKSPQTTTRELKEALTAIRDYLFDLFGDDSTDKEAARQAFGIDLKAMGKGNIPIGTVAYFAMGQVPLGYLKADGSAVSRTTYPDLFASIGTTYGTGDGSTTFNLPDLIGRFAEGSITPGIVKNAGLPNVTGTFGCVQNSKAGSGAFDASKMGFGFRNGTGSQAYSGNVAFDASRSTPIYGASSTVQPPALTLLPCIKAFHA